MMMSLLILTKDITMWVIINMTRQMKVKEDLQGWQQLEEEHSQLVRQNKTRQLRIRCQQILTEIRISTQRLKLQL